MKKTNTLLYSVYETPHPDKDGEQLYHVRPVTYGDQMTDCELRDYLQANTRVNTSQFVAMIEALREEIPCQLLQNRCVHIEHFGTFYLRLGVRRRQTADGQWYTPQFRHPSDITSADLQVEGIGFRADPSWNKRVQQAHQRFESAPYAGHGVTLHEEALLHWLDNYLAEHRYITVRQFKLAHDCTKYQARKTLEALCAGDQPTLRREQVGVTFVYRRWAEK